MASRLLPGVAEELHARPPVHLLHNSSSNVTRGRCLTVPASRVDDGMLVVPSLLVAAARVAVGRAYLPTTIAVAKRIAAVKGKREYERNRPLPIDGYAIVPAYVRDSSGRFLPV